MKANEYMSPEECGKALLAAIATAAFLVIACFAG